jgi:hypothetical protein
MPIKGTGHQLKGTPEYRAWVNMRQRCNNPSGHNAHYYKDISHCSEWNDPVRFLADMGKRPSVNHQLDRIDNTKGYSKENCRWVEKAPQMRNTRIAKWWFVDGVRYESVADAATQLGVGVITIKHWCDGKLNGKYKYPPRGNCWSEKKYAK